MAKISWKDYESLPVLLKALKESGEVSSTREGTKYVASLIPKEKWFQARIMDYLKRLQSEGVSIFFWKDQGGPYQRGGIPDICAVIEGKFFGFEVKRPFIGKVSEIQRGTLTRLNAAGGHAHVVHYPEEVEKILRDAQVIA